MNIAARYVIIAALNVGKQPRRLREVSMKICVAGLGLIGGSLCMSLKRAGYAVDGYNRSLPPLQYALDHAVIDSKAEDFTSYDVVFVALPPQATVDFILRTPFKERAVVADVCGVKRMIETAVYGADRNIRYVGTHPMAGKEVSSVYHACADLFDRASMVVTRGIYTEEEAYGIVVKLVKDMGFQRLVECSAEVHDRKIAYTSQLAHIVSNCYVKDGEIESCLGFTGGSFQDMTRIAGVDEEMWAALYLANADNLSGCIERLGAHLAEVNAAIAAKDKERLRLLLREGRESFSDSKANSFQKESESFLTGSIRTTLLHE